MARPRPGISSGSRDLYCDECGCALHESEDVLCETCREIEHGDGPDDDFEYDQSFPG